MPSQRSLANLRPWKKGVSGNPGGRPKTLPITDVLKEELEKRGKHNVQVARAIARKLIELALAGNMDAIAMIGDRTEGKPTQRSEHSGPDGGPIPFEIPDTREALERRIAELLGQTSTTREKTPAKPTRSKKK